MSQMTKVILIQNLAIFARYRAVAVRQLLVFRASVGLLTFHSPLEIRSASGRGTCLIERSPSSNLGDNIGAAGSKAGEQLPPGRSWEIGRSPSGELEMCRRPLDFLRRLVGDRCLYKTLCTPPQPESYTCAHSCAPQETTI